LALIPGSRCHVFAAAIAVSVEVIEGTCRCRFLCSFLDAGNNGALHRLSEPASKKRQGTRLPIQVVRVSVAIGGEPEGMCSL
jgi:hypothetical protein